MQKSFLLFFNLFLVAFAKKREFDHPKVDIPDRADTTHEDKEYWLQLGKDAILESLKGSADINTNLAKNVILFVGDGMSLPTLTASRIYKAQYEARESGLSVNGEETYLSFEKFPHVGLSKTYSVNTQTSDSAASGTALFSGVKTDYATIGFDNTIKRDDPFSELTATKVETILQWAQDAGMETGFVTNTRLSDATPASLYAHTAERDWECEQEMPVNRPKEVKDITWQLVNNDPGRRAKVVMGGGRSSFLPLHQQDDRWDYSEDDWECRRDDETNLIDQFLNKSALVPGFEGMKGVLLQNRGDLLNLDTDKTDYVLGIFNWYHMKYESDREAEADSLEGEPSLTEMTEAAIKMLSKGSNGYLLVVEGGKIDKSHHSAKAVKAMHETMAFDRAISRATEIVNFEDTLVIVTADHGHVMTMAGYPTRGADIRGLSDRNSGSDKRPYTILSYANGAGFSSHLTVEGGKVARVDLTDLEDQVKGFEYNFPSSVPLSSETHSGADVGIFAKGPFAHLFHSVHEQSFVAHVVAYSSCIGPYVDDCHATSGRATGLKKP